MRGWPALPPVVVARETALSEPIWRALAQTRRDPFLGARLAAHDTGRHVILQDDVRYDASAPRVVVRVIEGPAGTAPRRLVPRRLSIPLVDPAALLPDAPSGPRASGFRIWRPSVFPGAAYPIPETATGIRGRVVRDGALVRWARVEARDEDDRVVGRAHGDDRGEFLLILDPAAAPPGDPTTTLDFTLLVRAPAAAPDPTSASPAPFRAQADPYWDLPLETLPAVAASDPVSRGEVTPPGYTLEESWLLEGVTMGRITSYSDAFDIA